jgi:hypothetical protein
MKTTNIAMIALGLLVVALAVVLPGFQVSIVLLGGALAGWGTFGLLT